MFFGAKGNLDANIFRSLRYAHPGPGLFRRGKRTRQGFSSVPCARCHRPLSVLSLSLQAFVTDPSPIMPALLAIMLALFAKVPALFRIMLALFVKGQYAETEGTVTKHSRDREKHMEGRYKVRVKVRAKAVLKGRFQTDIRSVLSPKRRFAKSGPICELGLCHRPVWRLRAKVRRFWYNIAPK